MIVEPTAAAVRAGQRKFRRELFVMRKDDNARAMLARHAEERHALIRRHDAPDFNRTELAISFCVKEDAAKLIGHVGSICSMPI